MGETKIYTFISVTPFLRIANCFKGILAEAEARICLLELKRIMIFTQNCHNLIFIWTTYTYTHTRWTLATIL